MISVLLFLIISGLALYRPMIGLAVGAQVYLFRALTELNTAEVCFAGECAIESSPLLGLALPLTVFAIVIFKASLEKRGKVLSYRFDFVDAFFASYILVMALGCLYSPDIEKSIEYFARFVLIGVSYFFVTKLYLTNVHDKQECIRHFFLSTYLSGLFLSLVALYFFLSPGVFTFRMTIPGTHPIPFSLLIGQCFLIGGSIFLDKGRFLGISNSLLLRLNIPITIYFAMAQLATNTRGVTLSMVIGFFLLLTLSKNALSLNRLIFVVPVLILAFSAVLFSLDVDTLFHRFGQMSFDASVRDRIAAYYDAVNIFADHLLLGGGTASFSHYSFLGYPHNLFLENVASFGLLGLCLNVALIGIFGYFFIKVISKRKHNFAAVVFFSLTAYFFVETMFSFTLWMHKSLYLHFALLSCFQYFDRFSEKK